MEAIILAGGDAWRLSLTHPSIIDDPPDGSIVSTKAFCLATTKVQPQSCQT